MFTSTNTGNVEINFTMNRTIRNATVDFRKSGCEDVFDYVVTYAEKNCNGKLATAILEIIKEHKYIHTDHKVVIMQGNVKLGELG